MRPNDLESERQIAAREGGEQEHGECWSHEHTTPREERDREHGTAPERGEQRVAEYEVRELPEEDDGENGSRQSDDETDLLPRNWFADGGCRFMRSVRVDIAVRRFWRVVGGSATGCERR